MGRDPLQQRRVAGRVGRGRRRDAVAPGGDRMFEAVRTQRHRLDHRVPSVSARRWSTRSSWRKGRPSCSRSSRAAFLRSPSCRCPRHSSPNCSFPSFRRRPARKTARALAAAGAAARQPPSRCPRRRIRFLSRCPKAPLPLPPSSGLLAWPPRGRSATLAVGGGLLPRPLARHAAGGAGADARCERGERRAQPPSTSSLRRAPGPLVPRLTVACHQVCV